MLLAAQLHRIQLLLQMFDAQPDAAPVDLELGLAGAARADAAAQPGERVTRADEVRGAVPQLGELDLQFAFARPGVACEDIQDEHRPVDHAQVAERFFQGGALTRSQAIERDEGIGAQVAGTLRDFLHLAGTEQRRRVDMFAPLHDALHDLCARGTRERVQLAHLDVEQQWVSAGVHAGEDDALALRAGIV